MFKRPKRRIPGLNMTSTADISFMLLIFFLVTSSMDTDKGLARHLPPAQQEEREVEQKVKERNVMELRIDANDLLTCNGEPIQHDELTERIKVFVANRADDPTLPEKSVRDVNFFGRCSVSDRHILSVQVDRQTSYDAYFQLQNSIVSAYRQLRNELAVSKFGRTYNRCTQTQREAIGMVYPQRISEESPSIDEQQEKGGIK